MYTYIYICIDMYIMRVHNIYIYVHTHSALNIFLWACVSRCVAHVTRQVDLVEQHNIYHHPIACLSFDFFLGRFDIWLVGPLLQETHATSVEKIWGAEALRSMASFSHVCSLTACHLSFVCLRQTRHLLNPSLQPVATKGFAGIV